MRKHIFNNRGDQLLRVEEAEPKCGEAYCDGCGDCLHCYGGDPCLDGYSKGGEHYWVVYSGEKQEAQKL